MSVFGKRVGVRNKLGGFRHKRKVGIDEGDGISREDACVGGHQEFVEFIGLWFRIAAVVFSTSRIRLEAQAYYIEDTCRFGRGTS